jgi:hypothetical protein
MPAFGPPPPPPDDDELKAMIAEQKAEYVRRLEEAQGRLTEIQVAMQNRRGTDDA